MYANTSQEWYNYDKKEWANAVVLKSGVTKSVGQTISESDIDLWYVWIPRYKYTIFNGNNEEISEQEIKVTFEQGTVTTGTVKCVDAINKKDNEGNKISETCTDSTNGSIVNGTSTYTHPAFTFGDKELTGIWVGKFENSGTTDHITILPNVSSQGKLSVSASFVAIQNIKTTYGINNGDSHMMKNMEWGSVAYLKQSKYGLGMTVIGINNNETYITGCGDVAGSLKNTTCNQYDTIEGMLASTTGNIYGIYDMSGGRHEYVMGNMMNSDGNFNPHASYFSSTPNSKYYDAYTYDNPTYTSHSRGKLGDATKEILLVKNGFSVWYKNYSNTTVPKGPWILRGGIFNESTSTGIFTSNYNHGDSSDNGFRSVLVSE